VADDEAQLAEYALGLASQLREDLPAWVERSVASRTDLDLTVASHAAGVAAAADLGGQIDELLACDIDQQRSTPLTLLRHAVRYPTEVLALAGVPESRRDDFSRRSFPDDGYDLAPASLADISLAAQEAGIHWGAAKAHVHLARRRVDRSQSGNTRDTEGKQS
jgi:hypothetical protein